MHDYINAKVQWPSEDWRGERVIDTYQDPASAAISAHNAISVIESSEFRSLSKLA